MYLYNSYPQHTYKLRLLITIYCVFISVLNAIEYRNQYLSQQIITVGERKVDNLHDYVSGYNLTFTKKSTQNWITIEKKLQRLTKNPLNGSISLDQCWIDKQPNGKFDNLFACLDNSIVHFGYIPDNSSEAPYFFKSLQLEYNEEHTILKCYDLEKIRGNLFIVDCSYSMKIDKYQIPQNNLWFEIRIKSPYPHDFQLGAIKQYKTSILKYFGDSETRQTYQLIKGNMYYIFHAVKSSTDSFLEIYAYRAQKSFELIQIWDKTTFKFLNLIIEDMKIHNHNIFIVDLSLGIIRVKFSNPFSFQYSLFKPERKLSRVAVISEYEIGRERLTLLLATIDQGLYEVDWTELHQPYEKNSYDLDTNSSFDVLKIDMSDQYIICQTEDIPDDLQISSYLNIFRRGEKLLKNVFLRIPLHKTLIPFEFNQVAHSFIFFNFDSINTYQLLDANIIFQPQQLTKESELVIEVTSCKEQEICEKIQIQSLIKVVKFNDEATYLIQNPEQTHPSIYINYPGIKVIPLKNYVSGPGVNFTLDDKSLKTLDYLDIDTAEEKNLNLGFPLYFKIKEQKQLFTQFESALHANGHDYFYMFFAQIEESDKIKPLFVQICEEIISGLSCQAIGRIDLVGTIQKLVVTKQYIYLKEDSNKLKIQLYNRKTLQSVDNITEIEYVDECNDLDLVRTQHMELVLCTKVHKKEISILNYAENYYTQLEKIDKNIIAYRGFKPEQVTTTELFPDLIFVKSLNEIIIINIAQISAKQVHYVQSIKSDATKSRFDIAITKNGLLIINPQIQRIELWDISYPPEPIIRTFLPLYEFTLSTKDQEIGGYYDTSIHNHVFFILAQNTSNRVVLAYHTQKDKSTHNLLYQVIVIQQKPNDKIYIDTASIKESDQFLIITSEKQYYLWKVFDQPSLTIQSKFRNQNDQFEFSIYQIQYQNFKGKKKNFNINSTLWNSGGNILRTSQIASKIFIKENQNGQSESISTIKFKETDYFHGHILNYQIECDFNECNQNGGNAILIPKFEEKRKFVNHKKTNVKDIKLTEKYLLLLTETRLFIYDAKARSKMLFVVDLITDFGEQNLNHISCNSISMHQSLFYAIALCNNEKTKKGYLVLVSFLNYKPVPVEKFLINLPNLNEVVVKDDFIFVLAHRMHKSSKILLFLLDIHDEEQSQIRIQTLKPIDAAIWGESNFLPVDIEIVANNNIDQYTVFITDSSFGIRYAQIKFNKEEGFYTLEPKSIDLRSFFINELQPINQVEWLGIDVNLISQQDKYQNYQILITSRNFHHYDLQVKITESTHEIKILQMYQAYGDYEIDDVMAASKRYFGIITKRHQIDPQLKDALLIYDRTIVASHEFNSTYSHQEVIGALYFESPTTAPSTKISTSFLIADEGDNNGIIWKSSQNNHYKVVEYYINNEISIQVKPNSKFLSQNIIFKVSNDYRENSIKIPIQLIKQDNSVPNTKSSHLYILWIILAVIIVLLTLWYFRRRKQLRGFSHASLISRTPLISHG